MHTIDQAWLRDRPTRKQVVNDIVLGVLLAVFGLLAAELLRSAPMGVEMGWRGIEGYLWSVSFAVALSVRRLFPLASMVLCSLFFYGSGERVTQLSFSIVVQMSLFIAIYTAWAWSRHRRALIALSAVIVVAMFVWVVQLLGSQDVGAGERGNGLFDPVAAVTITTLAVNAIYFFGAIAWGQVSWRAARQRYELEQQSEALRREQDENARRAVADERVRIARDLHDVVAHHVSGIGIQAAGAGRMLDRDPDQSREALSVIERSSRTAVQEMHQLVTLLRTDEPPDASDRGPQPGLSNLRSLAGGFASQGLPVDFRQAGDAFTVPGTVGLSMFRIGQEALANVRRHSTAKTASMTLRYLRGDTRAVEIEVIDGGSPRPVASKDTHGGFGLKGIAERAGLHDGETEIGPRPGGGFRVRVRVPVLAER